MIPLPRGDHAVISSSPEAHARPGLPAALAEALGMPVADGARRWRRSRGILLERVSADAARRIAAALGRLGFDARAVSGTALPVPPEPRVLAGLRFAPDGVVARLRGGREETAPWERIAVLAAARFAVETSREETVAEGPGPARATAAVAVNLLLDTTFDLDEPRAVRRTVTRTESRLLLDLLLEEPPERWRIRDPAEGFFDFSGLGPAMVPASKENLRSLLEVLASALPGVPVGPGARALLARGDMAALAYREAGDLDREIRWLAALARAGSG